VKIFAGRFCINETLNLSSDGEIRGAIITIVSHLPESAGVCMQYGAAMKQLVEDISEQLDYIPASFRVIRDVHRKFTSTCCDQIAQASAPGRPIARGLAGPGLLGRTLTSQVAEIRVSAGFRPFFEAIM
jgi:hypothetical protein